MLTTNFFLTFCQNDYCCIPIISVVPLLFSCLKAVKQLNLKVGQQSFRPGRPHMSKKYWIVSQIYNTFWIMDVIWTAYFSNQRCAELHLLNQNESRRNFSQSTVL